jgi:hypothetical protein
LGTLPGIATGGSPVAVTALPVTMNYPKETMDDILFKQSVSGAWKCDEKIARILGIAYQVILEAAPEKVRLLEMDNVVILIG